MAGMPQQPPRGLQEAGRRAWRAARDHVEGDDAYRELVDAYARAADRARALAQEWESGEHRLAGRGGANPLFGAMERAELHLAKLARELELTPATATAERKRGRPPGKNPLEALGLGGLRVVK